MTDVTDTYTYTSIAISVFKTGVIDAYLLPFIIFSQSVPEESLHLVFKISKPFLLSC